MPSNFSDTDSVIAPSATSSGHLIFSEEDSTRIRLLFPFMIDGKNMIRRCEVIPTIEEKCPILLKKYTENQILSRVRTEKRAADRRRATNLKKK